MLRKLSSQLSGAVSSLSASGDKLPPQHDSAGRAESYAKFAEVMNEAHIPADSSDCAACDHPCTVGPEDGTSAGTIAESGQIWDGKSYRDYVMDKYGDLGELPKGFDTDWDSELAGSGQPARGRVVVISTGKSNWERDHTVGSFSFFFDSVATLKCVQDEKDSFAYQLDQYLQTLPANKAGKGPKRTVDFDTRPPLDQFIAPVAPIAEAQLAPPSLYSSSLISQADDPEDQSVLVFPDWKVVHEVENTREGAERLYQDALRGGLGKAGEASQSESDREGVGRKRSWVLPYRAVILLCSHKRRDNRCHIAAPLLRSALITCLSKYDITVDETGSSLCGLNGPPLEELEGDEAAREAETQRRIDEIESVHGGEGGEVGIFNINHLGGHRYAGVMLVLLPSGAFLSYGRVTPQEIPRVVEDTILKGKIVPGLLRAAAGVERSAGQGHSLLKW
ncbi:Sucrase/ferredoxin-like-domain-containing protein [Kockovaella imperatae]|uniref:Sucrase/ferredoxin-like-domain-containing protein n=1 Tax=Kockovaella imperatae TaxID=4999 RepID=A0A1Y1UIJ7_9TREE|nr:Sucrase/ferredoxin-like-domain-containing protein [Kockovaella imperatae]ORX37377.1 Sucrase/ferredoxin-like-domain-containing protein [Kockovaella imperatae]